jgi:ERCC4-type nuclease
MRVVVKHEPYQPKIDIPEGFVLVVDTREQTPLFQPNSKPWIIQSALKTGDYSVKGFENLIVIERKSLSDLFSSLGKERERFKKELKRMEKFVWKGLLIEGSERDILSCQEYSGMHPNAVYHSLSSIEVRYGVHIYYAKKIKRARWWVLSRLTRFYKLVRNGELMIEGV